MRVTIAKCFDFDAAHRLPRLPKGHKCRRWHGHTYRVEIRLTGYSRNGMLLDYAEIEKAWKPLKRRLDHRRLNDVEGLGNPTTEVLAEWILWRLLPVLPMTSSVVVHESSTTWCEAKVEDLILPGEWCEPWTPMA